MTETATKQINVRIPVELHERLAAHKEATNEDKSDVVRRGIELALGVESSPPPQDVDALIAALGELRRARRLDLEQLVAKLNKEFGLGPQASQQDRVGDPPSSPPADATPDGPSGDEAAAEGAMVAGNPAESERREAGGSDDSTSSSSTSDEEPESERAIDLVAWLAERTNLPMALLRARIGNGKVFVAGRVWHDLEIPVVLLDQVELDGERV